MTTRSPASLLPEHPLARILLLLILIGGIYFFYGFIVPVLAALIIGFASWPIYQRIVRLCRGHTTPAAIIALFLVLLVLVIPLALILTYSIHEIRVGLTWVKEANRTGITPPAWLATVPLAGQQLLDSWQDYLGKPSSLSEVISFLSDEHLGHISKWVLAAGGSIFHFTLFAGFMLITLFFVYKDGTYLVSQLDRVGERILPDRWQHFSRVVPVTVSATVTGMGIVAIGEGVVLGIAYHIAGVPSAFTLGVITAFMALVPGGAPTAFTLVSLYLVSSGHVVAGCALFAWGVIELFIVDKTIRPQLIGGPIRLPFLPTFFGLIGGLKTLGIVGLFLGPVFMALLVAIWREWILMLDQSNAKAKHPPQP
ncbi:MAG: AI-2E family transporter [Chthoniobacterales bacterium]